MDYVVVVCFIGLKAVMTRFRILAPRFVGVLFVCLIYLFFNFGVIFCWVIFIFCICLFFFYFFFIFLFRVCLSLSSWSVLMF